MQLVLLIASPRLLKLRPKLLDQANAATEANTVARELNVIARRPWIPPNLVVSAIMFAENNQADIILDFKLKNYGLTSATNVEPLITHDADWLFRQHPFDPMEYAKIQQKFCSFNRKVSVTGNTVSLVKKSHIILTSS
jgi:hypothetical protein